jgi:anion-transporting  ArsA/GET3 family ATPase
MFDGIGTTVGIELAGLSKTQIKKQLPQQWCMQCLDCHPYPDKAGRHHHIRSLRDNAAMHEAIRAGDLPPVDPWHDIVEALNVAHPQTPEPPRPQESRMTYSSFEATEEEKAELREQMMEKSDLNERVDCIIEHMNRKDEAQRRNELLQTQPQPFALYANAAPAAFNSTYPLSGARMQPTGPPPKKRKYQAFDNINDQQPGHANGNARSKRKYAINSRDSVIQKAQTPDGDDDQTVLETVQAKDVPENSTSSKMPQTDEAATAVNQTAAFKKLT